MAQLREHRSAGADAGQCGLADRSHRYRASARIFVSFFARTGGMDLHLVCPGGHVRELERPVLAHKRLGHLHAPEEAERNSHLEMGRAESEVEFCCIQTDWLRAEVRAEPHLRRRRPWHLPQRYLSRECILSLRNNERPLVYIPERNSSAIHLILCPGRHGSRQQQEQQTKASHLPTTFTRFVLRGVATDNGQRSAAHGRSETAEHTREPGRRPGARPGTRSNFRNNKTPRALTQPAHHDLHS